MGFPDGTPANVGDIIDRGMIPGLEGPLKKGMATHSIILAWRIPIDREAWQATVHRVTKTWTRLKHLSTHAHCI